MIHVNNLIVRLGDRNILRGINLDVKSRETLVVIGPSGHGKTVLIKSLAGLICPEKGRIEFDGLNIVGLSRKKRLAFQKRCGFVFQDNALFDYLNIRENLSLYLRMHKVIGEKTILSRILETIRKVGLESDVLNKYPEELSGGMKKRAAIARSILKQPDYLFYDEPTLGLDSGNSEKVCVLIQSIQEQSAMTSVIVTHDLSLMKNIADRVALLKYGRIQWCGRPEEVSEEMILDFYEEKAKNTKDGGIRSKRSRDRRLIEHSA